jgi:hypothetical protein
MYFNKKFEYMLKITRKSEKCSHHLSYSNLAHPHVIESQTSGAIRWFHRNMVKHLRNMGDYG